MIKSIKHKGLRRFFERNDPSKLSVPNVKRVRLILEALDAATRYDDLNQPGWRWHPLKEMMPGFYSVEASGNWRIVYRWEDGPADVDLVDYH